MNKSEVSEIKNKISKDDGLMTLNKVLTAFVDNQHQVRTIEVKEYSEIESTELELIRGTILKVLSTSVGKTFVEYAIPNDDGGIEIQDLLFKLVKDKLEDEDINTKFIQNIADNTDYESSYAIITTHFSYTVPKKNKADDILEDNNTDFNFIITAICPANLTEYGYMFNNNIQDNNDDGLYKKDNSELAVDKSPKDGFMYPTFSDRSTDVNHIMYYTKKAKEPNLSIIEEVLKCNFIRSANEDKIAFMNIISDVLTDEVNYSNITEINDKIQEIIAYNKNDTDIPTIDKIRLKTILLEVGIEPDKVKAVDTLYDQYVGKSPLVASNLVESKTVVAIPEITVNISKEGKDKVRTANINGRKCIIIDVDDNSVEINNFTANL